jgi:hypothetical protein
MDFLDLMIVATVVVNITLGVRFGVMRRVVAAIGLFLGVGAATLVSANTSIHVASTFGLTSALWTHVVTYIGIVVGSVLLFEILGMVYSRFLESLVAAMFDAASGGVLGALLGVVEVALGLYVGIGLINTTLPAGYAYPPSFVHAQELILGSFFAPHFYGLFPLTKVIFAAVLPSSIGNYFTQLLQTN